MPKLLIESCPLQVTRVDDVTPEYTRQFTERVRSRTSSLGHPYPGWKPILVCEGLMQVGDIGNRNKRKYPTKLWDRIVQEETTKKRLEAREVLGEVDHPGDGETKAIRTSHIVTDAWMDGSKVFWRWEVLDTPNGKILAELLRAGAGVAGSTRGHGDTVKIEGDLEEVQDNYQWVTTDIVVNPSVIQSDYTAADVTSRREQVEHAILEGMRGCRDVDELQEYREATQRLLGDLDPDTCDRVLEVIERRLAAAARPASRRNFHQEKDVIPAVESFEDGEQESLFEAQDQYEARLAELTSSLEEVTRLARELETENARLRRDALVGRRAATQAQFESAQVKQAAKEVAAVADDRITHMKTLIHAGAQAQQRVTELEAEVSDLRDALREQAQARQEADEQVVEYARAQILSQLPEELHERAALLASGCATLSDVERLVEALSGLQVTPDPSDVEPQLTLDEAMAAATEALAACQPPKPRRKAARTRIAERAKRPRVLSQQFREVLGESVMGAFGNPSLPPRGTGHGPAPDFAMSMIEKLRTRLSPNLHG